MLGETWFTESSSKTGTNLGLRVGRTRAETRASCNGCPLAPNATGSKGCQAFDGRRGMSITAQDRAIASNGARYDLAAVKVPRKVRSVRLGTIGDPGALELWRMRAIYRHLRARFAGPVLSYTHHWARKRSSEWARYAMASCHGLDQLDEAASVGWRGFAMMPADTPPGSVFRASDGRRVVHCVNDRMKAAGHPEPLTCDACGVCDAGRTELPHVWIAAHGPTVKRAEATL